MNNINRRMFIQRSGAALGAAALFPVNRVDSSPIPDTSKNWADVRNQFSLNPDYIHMALMLLASHPRKVKDAIAEHRRKFDNDPVTYWEENYINGENRVRIVAAQYMGCTADEIALTDSTTMGLGTLYSGLQLTFSDEILTTTHDHYSTEKSLDFAAIKSNAKIKRIALYQNPATITVDEVLTRLKNGIDNKTRIVAVTWVHSSTGVKLPIHEMSAVIKEANQQRSPDKRIYFCVDGVHGFGIENINMAELGCDFFVAGTHKWLFGPRGTGIIFGRKEAWDMVTPTIPSFSYNSYSAW